LRLVGIDAQRSTINAAGHFGGRNISIGKGAFINYGLFIDNTDRVTIGNDCSLGPNVTILTGTHEIGPSTKRAGTDRGLPVHIGDGSWLGANVTVLPGVTIGTGAMIAAGAVVTKDCEPNGLYAGVPARKIRNLS
jgi:maltose O-acetyltransferase